MSKKYKKCLDLPYFRSNECMHLCMIALFISLCVLRISMLLQPVLCIFTETFGKSLCNGVDVLNMVDDAMLIKDEGLPRLILAELNQRRQTGTWCDLQIQVPTAMSSNVQLKTFPVHSCVVAATSKYFLSLVGEGQSPCVIKDVDQSCFEMCLDFIYGQNVFVPQDRLSAVSKCAETLELHGLVKLCQNAMVLALDTQSKVKAIKNELESKNPLETMAIQAAVDSERMMTREFRTRRSVRKQRNRLHTCRSVAMPVVRRHGVRRGLGQRTIQSPCADDIHVSSDYDGAHDGDVDKSLKTSVDIKLTEESKMWDDDSDDDGFHSVIMQPDSTNSSHVTTDSAGELLLTTCNAEDRKIPVNSKEEASCLVNNKESTSCSMNRKESTSCSVKSTKLDDRQPTANQRTGKKSVHEWLAISGTTLEDIDFDDVAKELNIPLDLRPKLTHHYWPEYLKSSFRGTPRSAYRFYYVHYHMPVGCKQCGEEFTGSLRLRRHESRAHAEQLFCSHCAKPFTSYASLTAHEQRHQGVVKDRKCKYCDYKTSSRASLSSHLQNAHADKLGHEIPLFLCSHCASKFTSKNDLTRHELRVHFKEQWKNEQHKHKCSVCNFIGFTRRDLEHHVVKHSDARPFVCQVCQHCAFKTVAQKNQHIRKVHGMAPPDIGRKHRDVQLLAPKPKEQKLHPCPYCAYIAKNKGNYNLHLKIHFDHRPYKCAHCPEAFKRRDVLVRHGKRHHNVDLRTDKFKAELSKKLNYTQ